MDAELKWGRAKARKSLARCFRASFYRLLEPGPESLQINAPGYDFVDFWSQGEKVFKSMFQGAILLNSEPGPETHEIVIPGCDFVDFWSRGKKVMKSMLQGMFFMTSKAKTRKS